MGTQPAEQLDAPAGEERYRAGELVQKRYHLVKPLGQGGFARVWVAHDSLLDLDVALKLIYLDDDTPDANWERLLQEARSAARLGHSAIVRVFDFGQAERGDPYVAMELLEGETFFDLIRREGRLPAERAVQLLLPIADALATAHAKGIVHRDVKPENVFIARDELGRVQPKLLDFGIARRTDVDRKLTAKGAVVGTPDYMSPEQARGENVIDARTDVWSFCVMVFEAVTGRTPFAGDNYNALLNAIINQEPTSSVSYGGGDAELWRLLEQGLKKKPEERWDSMRMLGEALALWLYERGVREDACAGSLRTSWLETDFADVKIDVTSQSPPQRTTAPSARAALPPSPAPSAEGNPPDVHQAATRQMPAASANRRVAWIGAVLALLVVGAIAALMLGRRGEPEPTVEGDEVPPSQAAQPTSISSNVPRQPAAVATPTEPTPAPSARGSRAKPGMQGKVPAPAKPTPAGTSVEPAKPAGKPPGKPAAPDFGF